MCDGGANFENAYYEVHAPVSTAAPMVCARKRKSPLNNSYASLTSSISFAHSAVHVRRMHRFIATTLAGTDGIRLLLSMYAIVAAGVRLPEVILFFLGEGGEGKSLLLSTLGRDFWGPGRSEASGAMLQTEGEFRRQGHLYRKLRRMSFGESKPTAGISGEISKLFFSG